MNKKQEKQITITVIIIILLLSFVVGYTLFSKMSYTYTHEGTNGQEFSFVKTPQGDHKLNWSVSYRNGMLNYDKNYITPFSYSPEEVEDIYLEEFKDLFNAAPKIYITRDVNVDLVSDQQIAVMTFERVAERYIKDVSYASIEENERSEFLRIPVKNCGGYDEETLIIFFEQGLEDKIYLRDNCVIVEFVEDPVRVATRLTYYIIGVL